MTKAGTQRWRCLECGASQTHTNDVTSRDLDAFLKWLLSKGRQTDMPGGGRSFRRRVEPFWKIWPTPEFVDEIHRVVYIDGIYLGREAVILIARSDDYVLSWHLARSKNSRAYKALLEKIAPPEMVVSDGGTGFAKAVKQVWPNVPVQRCLFHVFCQVKRYTTSRPRLQAGMEIYQIAKKLLHIKTLKQAEEWVDSFMEWCNFWSDFLEEKTQTERGPEFTHERPRKARRSIAAVLNQGTMFTYLKPELCIEKPMPSTNNRIGGATNAKIREMLRNHRGLSLTRRIKAAFWLCYMDTECPKKASEIVKSMPTDDDMDYLRDMYGIARDPYEPAEWGDGIVWEEFHHKTRYLFAVD